MQPQIGQSFTLKQALASEIYVGCRKALIMAALPQGVQPPPPQLLRTPAALENKGSKAPAPGWAALVKAEAAKRRCQNWQLKQRR
jgi:hypothetical protein